MTITLKYWHQSSFTKKWYTGQIRNLTKSQIGVYVKQLNLLFPDGQLHFKTYGN